VPLSIRSGPNSTLYAWHILPILRVSTVVADDQLDALKILGEQDSRLVINCASPHCQALDVSRATLTTMPYSPRSTLLSLLLGSTNLVRMRATWLKVGVRMPTSPLQPVIRLEHMS